jgi:hypothetical protein
MKKNLDFYSFLLLSNMLWFVNCCKCPYGLSKVMSKIIEAKKLTIFFGMIRIRNPVVRMCGSDPHPD